MEQARRPRGRPRRYDPGLALERARDTFWRNGYGATSLDELSAAMGMNRPSIYAGFGDKRELYQAAITRYAADSHAALASELAKPRPLRAGLRAVYENARKYYLAGDDGPRGCFLVGTAVTEARRDERVAAIAESTFDGFTELFGERFERAKREGELSSTAAPRALAEVATAALITIAVRTRTGATSKRINAMIDATLAVLFAD
ncbi:TetR family transcriptional regulator [Mycobacterium sp. MFM001]|uniref:TetR/AcrR family transcriptional regulator n=1 Tax=Mycobacterium sp. MFM001 TaxID=2049453 RepID=UPI000DA46480|nr:TetR/AcrR family transcriptional regulator [Mycobacterium sp. MFM001]GBE67353.1 TetR family transcriptional regulator [Mycobacterium sp. MFM001]